MLLEMVEKPWSKAPFMHFLHCDVFLRAFLGKTTNQPAKVSSWKCNSENDENGKYDFKKSSWHILPGLASDMVEKHWSKRLIFKEEENRFQDAIL